MEILHRGKSLQWHGALAAVAFQVLVAEGEVGEAEVGDGEGDLRFSGAPEAGEGDGGTRAELAGVHQRMLVKPLVGEIKR